MSEIFKHGAEEIPPRFDAVGDIDEARSHCEQWQLRHLSPDEVIRWWNTHNEELDDEPIVLWNTNPGLVYTYIYHTFGR